MSQLQGLIAALARNPGVLRSFIENPQAFARLAGLGETELRAVSGITNGVSGLWNRLGDERGDASTGSSAVARPANSSHANGQGVAIAGVVSLLAVVGAVAAVGTVSMVALAGRNEGQTR